MRNILFIVPPYFNFSTFKSDALDSIPVFTIPYGILSMEGYLKKYARNEIKIELIDLNLEAFKTIGDVHNNNDLEKILYQKVQKKIDQHHYDIVGISALFNNAYTFIDRLSSIIKSGKNPPLCIIGGGLGSNLYHEILDKFVHVDAVCLAEGEIPMLDLVNADDMQSVLDHHKSWITRSKLEQRFKFEPSYIENLDEIPILQYDLIELDYYNGRSVDKRFAHNKTKREFSIHTSRGCPYICVYCSNTSIHGKKVRIMSLKRVMEEIDYMIDRYGMNVLLIEDDHFLADTARVIIILNEIAKRKIRIEFPNGISVKGIDEELGAALKNAGVSAVNLAVESGSNYVLKKLIKKPHLDRHIKPAVEILRRNGIRVHAFIVLGLPGELPEHRHETMEMIKDVGFDWIYFFLAVPIVGSRLYDICIANDYLIDKDFSKHVVSNATIKAPGVDPEHIGEEMYRMNLEANFINNWNVQNKNFEIALPYFENMVKKYASHAFGYLILYTIKKEMWEDESITVPLYEKYKSLVTENAEWRKYANYFNLVI